MSTRCKAKVQISDVKLAKGTPDVGTLDFPRLTYGGVLYLNTITADVTEVNYWWGYITGPTD